MKISENISVLQLCVISFSSLPTFGLNYGFKAKDMILVTSTAATALLSLLFLCKLNLLESQEKQKDHFH